MVKVEKKVSFEYAAKPEIALNDFEAAYIWNESIKEDLLKIKSRDNSQICFVPGLDVTKYQVIRNHWQNFGELKNLAALNTS